MAACAAGGAWEIAPTPVAAEGFQDAFSQLAGEHGRLRLEQLHGLLAMLHVDAQQLPHALLSLRLAGSDAITREDA